jgi:hypothetical protein
MKILYYDCFSGISGDMNLGAMVDLGVDGDWLIGELNKLAIRDDFSVRFEKQQKMGITGTKVLIEETKHQHAHRHLKDIEAIIDDSTLNERVRTTAKGIFRRVADAEGKVHGTTADQVHFHEVGAIDSIVDIVGAAICFDFWNVERILASPVQVGSGFVRCAHGLMPVPAPATAQILQGIPIKTGLVEGEATTPTGAAILAYSVDAFVDQVELKVLGIGYGLGTKDFNIPNVLRITLADVKEFGTSAKEEGQYILEANLDDMNPEFLPFAEERLFEAGALDVFKTPIIMKKGRPGVKLSVLCRTVDRDAMRALLFEHTTTLGIRSYSVEKTMMERAVLQVDTPWGPVDVKMAYDQGLPVKYKPEYEHCAALARIHQLNINQIYAEIHKKMQHQLEGRHDSLGQI